MFTEQDVRKILENITDPETGGNVASVGKFSITLNGGNVGVILDMPGQVTKSWEQNFKAKCINEIQKGTGDVHISLAKFTITGAVVVSTPQKLSVLQVVKTCDMLANLNIKISGVVENMSYFFDGASGSRTYVFGTGGAQDISRLTGAPFLGDIRIDPEICQTSERRDPTIGNTDLLKAYDRITENMLASVTEGCAM
ncbi:hypothetical protein GH714_042883 [Hevea brasiliensis]|uniref:Uncharacterized protein n=1 Tax=Hevea brasiliensis TaxID=3981 RepID=A0A6A6K3S8_HEVBR|nr:hypothetical protein GH714_042883 [Hevea brasiliensis]